MQQTKHYNAISASNTEFKQNSNLSREKDQATYIKANESEDENDIMADIKYICRSCSLITEALQRGADVLQMPNGDIFITETKRQRYIYTWDALKGKMVRKIVSKRLKKEGSYSYKYLTSEAISEDDIED